MSLPENKQIQFEDTYLPVITSNVKTVLLYQGEHFTSCGPDTFPIEIAGQPVSYYSKDIIKVGDFTHPIQKWTLHVTPDRLKQWAEKGNDMICSGVPIPVNQDHIDSASKVVGYVKSFKVDGDTLYAFCQIIGGPETQEMVARNFVSVGIFDNLTDCKDLSWKDAIGHVALTPMPVVSGQDTFVKAASKSNLLLSAELYKDWNEIEDIVPDPPIDQEQEGDTDDDTETLPDMLNYACSKETSDRLHELVPGLDKVADHEKLACVAQHIHNMSMNDMADAGGGDMTGMSRSQITELAQQNRQAWKSASKNAITPVSADTQEALVETFGTKLDMAFSRGAIDANCKRKLEALFSKDNVLAFSKSGSNKAIALSVVDILKDNKPVELKEKSGIQVLSKDSSGITEVLEHMYKVNGIKVNK